MTSKEIIGKVVSNKMNKTLVVAVRKRKADKKYKKIFETTKKFYVHDENNEYTLGDIVKIRVTRPLSKTKCWQAIEKVKISSK